MKIRSAIISFVFTVFLAGIMFAAPDVFADSIEYYADGTKYTADCTSLVDFEGETLDGYYYVPEDTSVKLTQALTVEAGSQTVIVLCNGSELTVEQGITIKGGIGSGGNRASLAIYGQKQNNGKLKAGSNSKYVINNQSSSEDSTTLVIGGGIISGGTEAVINNNGYMEMKGGLIKDSKIGIYNSSYMILRGGEISGNTTGICTNTNNTGIFGGYITGNEVGIEAGSNVRMKDSPRVQGNDKDVYLKGSSKIELIGEIKKQDQPWVGVSLENGSGVFTESYSTYNRDDSPKEIFFGNDGNVSSVLSGGEVKLFAKVSYLDENGDTQHCKVYTGISDVTDGDAWGTAGTETWYVVDEDKTFDKRVVLKGDVKLILADGKTLTCSKGIEVPGDISSTAAASLTIYAQSTDEDTMGKLVCVLTRDDFGGNGDRNAAIGGNADSAYNHCGDIAIHGGNIKAWGGNYGAGIGGADTRNSGKITITGGLIEAESYGYLNSTAAAIGGGLNALKTDEDPDDYSINISGGTISARAYNEERSIKKQTYGGGAGIGSGFGSKARYQINITGGNITAGGDTNSKNSLYTLDAGPGIGAGINSAGADVVISGENKSGQPVIKAFKRHQSKTNEPVIGGAASTNSTVTINDYGNMKVMYSKNGLTPDENVAADDRESVINATDNYSLLIEPCDHAEKYYTQTETDHIWTCDWCSEEFESEAHVYDGYSYNTEGHWQVCTECGYKTETEEHAFTEEDGKCVCGLQGVIVSFAAGKDAEGSMDSVTIGQGSNYTLPDNEGFTSTADKGFLGWYIGSGTTLKGAGMEITVDESVTLTAQWGETWASLRQRIIDAEDGDTITLYQDYGAVTGDTSLLIPEGKTVTIDLNGHKLDRGLESAAYDGAVIDVLGNLVIKDSAGGGMLTGGFNGNGWDVASGIVVDGEGQLTFTGGTITGVFGMGGAISVNSENAKAVMTGGTITSNRGFYAGAVYVYKGTFEMTGGTITENIGLGAVTVISDGTFNVSGSPVIAGNGSAEIERNVYLKDGSKINVTGMLTGDAVMGVSVDDSITDYPVVITTDVTEKANPANFTSDDTDYIPGIIKSGEGEDAEYYIILGEKTTLTLNSNYGDGSTEETQELDVAKGGLAYAPPCTFTPPVGKVFMGWATTAVATEVEYKELSLVEIKDATTLYAVWDASDTLHSVTAKAQTDEQGNALGTAYAYPSSAEAGASVTISATPADKYVFKGWTIDEGGVTLTDPASAQTTFKMGSSNVVVTAVFEPIAVEKVELYVKAASEDESESRYEKVTSLDLAEGDDETLLAAIYPQDAYDTSVTWTSSDPDIVSVSADEDETTARKATVTANKTGKATITVTTANGKTASCVVTVVGTVTVTFDPDNGSDPTKVEIRSGTAVTKPEDPEKEDYTFDSWQLGKNEFDFTTLITADTTLTAKWNHNHNEKTLTKTEATDATCEVSGNSEYYTCEVCSKYFSDVEGKVEIEDGDWVIPATGHDWDGGVVTTKPTCKDEGVKTYTCKNDDSHTKTEVIEADPDAHVWGDWTEGSDEKGSYKQRTCSVCGETQKVYDSSDCEHADRITIEAKAATCTADGYKSYEKCNTCGCYIATIDGEEVVVTADNVATLIEKLKIPATGHDWGEGEVTTEPTCYDAGVRTYTCANDDSHVKTEEIPALGHDWDEGTVTKEPTCSSTGVKTYTCKNNDKHTRTEVLAIDPDAHDYQEVEGTAKEATCTEAGKEADKVCSLCGEKVEGAEIAALGHNWSEWKVTKEATNASEGEKTRTCSRCGEVETQTIAKLDTKKTVLVAKGIAKGKRKAVISWNNVKADRYVVYIAKCNYNTKKYKFKKVKTLSGKKLKYTTKSLKKNRCYKFKVVAQKKVNGKYKKIATSYEGHFCTANVRGSLTNPKSMTLNKTEAALTKGSSINISAKVAKVKNNKKLATTHAKLLRYKSDNPTVAAVDASGKVTAKSPGTATIYVVTINGIWKTCKVTVK